MTRLFTGVCFAATLFCAVECCSMLTDSSLFYYYNFQACTLRFSDTTQTFKKCAGGCTSTVRYEVQVNSTEATDSIPSPQSVCLGKLNCCNPTAYSTFTGGLVRVCGGEEVSEPSLSITMPTSCACRPCYGTLTERKVGPAETSESSVNAAYCHV